MTNRQRIWTTALSVALTASVVLVATSVAYGQEITPQGMTVEIPIETILRGDPSELFLVGEASAPVGAQCVAELEGHNNRSVHPNNDILVGPATFTDIENGTFQAAGLTFTSDGINQVYVRLGGDGVFSAGFLLEVTCNPPTTTTTVTTTPPTSSSTVPPTSTTTTATTSPPTAPPASTTTSPPPVGGIDTGGGSCADGACGSLSPLTTWLLIGAVWFGISGLAWAAIAALKKEMQGE